MTCQSVMLSEPVTVRDTATLAEAVELLFRHRIKHLPVVDGGGRYLGLFGIHTLIRQLLPRAATLDAGTSLSDLGFVHDDLETLKQRLAGRLGEPVLRFTDRELRALAPGASLMEGLLRLYREHALLPVADPASGRLLGIVTYWGILARLTGRPG